METRIERGEGTDDNKYTVWVGNHKIQTVWADSAHAETVTREWVAEINKTYRPKSKKNKTLLVGLTAESSVNYANGVYHYRREKEKDPLHVLQICVGNHCLIYQLNLRSSYWRYQSQSTPKALRDFLYDNKTVVVGVGIEEVAKKLAEDHGLPTSRVVELRNLAKKNVSLVKLAKMVLGDECYVVKPGRMVWWNEEDDDSLSDDKIMYGTIDAFLVHEMGVKLLKETE